MGITLTFGSSVNETVASITRIQNIDENDHDDVKIEALTVYFADDANLQLTLDQYPQSWNIICGLFQSTHRIIKKMTVVNYCVLPENNNRCCDLISRCMMESQNTPEIFSFVLGDRSPTMIAVDFATRFATIISQSNWNLQFFVLGLYSSSSTNLDRMLDVFEIIFTAVLEKGIGEFFRWNDHTNTARIEIRHRIE